MKTWILGILCILVLGFSLVNTYILKPSDKTGFFYNQKVFEKFEGKIHLEKKLADLKQGHQKTLDSLADLIQSGRKDLINPFDKRVQAFAIQEKQLNEQYTAEIWKFINESVKEYGVLKEYDFIFGATGDGSLMFANENKDLTDEILVFVNSKYNGVTGQ